jgi:hypothetical protein
LVFQHGAEPRCAYCGLHLLEPYEHWLLLTVDHVIPKRLIQRNGRWGRLRNRKQIANWIEDATNCVICCSACNHFTSRIEISENILGNPPRNDSNGEWNRFLQMRNELFTQKREHAIKQHRAERIFWNESWRRPIICGE